MKTRQNIFNHLLICLLSADSAFLLCSVLFIILDHIITSDRIYNQLVPILSPMYYITLTLSIFLTVAISHERYVAIQYPIVHNQKMKSAKTRRISLLKYITVIMFLAVIFHVPKFFELEVVWTNSTSVANWTNDPNEKYLRYLTIFEHVGTREYRYIHNSKILQYKNIHMLVDTVLYFISNNNYFKNCFIFFPLATTIQCQC